MNFSEYYNRWVNPYVPDKGDNLLECEGQLRRLLQAERERCAKDFIKWFYETCSVKGDDRYFIIGNPSKVYTMKQIMKKYDKERIR